MAIIAAPAYVNPVAVATDLSHWFAARGFETKTTQAAGSQLLKARKASGFRSIVGADRALEVEVRTQSGVTEVQVRQGSWKTNVISNAAWLLATGGMNLLISGWSLVLQKELEVYVRALLYRLSEQPQVATTSVFFDGAEGPGSVRDQVKSELGLVECMGCMMPIARGDAYCRYCGSARPAI